MTPRSLDLLLAKAQIHDAVLRCARGTDRNDPDALRSTYWPGALDHHGVGFDGPVEEFVGYIDALSQQFSMVHQICNHLIEMDGDVAYGGVYVQAYLRSKTEPVTGSSLAGRYLDRYERRGGEWRIAERHIAIDRSRTDPVPDGGDDLVPSESRGTGTRDDPSYVHVAPLTATGVRA